ncbi:L-2-amino-thiazoline-4-carboxylic acid hydrolase [Planctomycetota bacterium]
MLVAMFNTIARIEGRDNAYEFVKSIFQKVAVYSMPALYQIDDLVRCEGDVFDNFVKFNVAWFKAMNSEGTWIVDEIKAEKDELSIVVTECANCVLGEAFGCPEIAKLGCDHDLAGYPVIIDRVNAEFRRPHKRYNRRGTGHAHRSVALGTLALALRVFVVNNDDLTTL